MKQQIVRFWREEDGVTALEYGILAAIVALLIGTIFYSQLKSLFNHLFGNMRDAVDNAGT